MPQAAGAMLLRCRKRKGDAALPVELRAQVAVDGVERRLLLFVLQGDIVQRAAFRPIGRGGTDGAMAQGDQLNGCSGVGGRRGPVGPLTVVTPGERRCSGVGGRSGPVGLLSVLVVLASERVGALLVEGGWGGGGQI